MRHTCPVLRVDPCACPRGRRSAFGLRSVRLEHARARGRGRVLTAGARPGTASAPHRARRPGLPGAATPSRRLCPILGRIAHPAVPRRGSRPAPVRTQVPARPAGAGPGTLRRWRAPWGRVCRFGQRAQALPAAWLVKGPGPAPAGALGYVAVQEGGHRGAVPRPRVPAPPACPVLRPPPSKPPSRRAE